VLAYHAVAQELETIPTRVVVKIYQYINDVLVGESQIEEVGEMQWDIITHLESIGLTIPPENIQAPCSEVKFFGIWWRGGMTCILPDPLSSLDLIKMPVSKKDLRYALGLLMFWRKHIPGFSIVTRPLYDLLRNNAQWEWTQVHEEASRLLVLKANAYQAPRPIRLTSPVQIEWGFAQTGLLFHLWQKGPEGPFRPIGFYSRSFKDAEKRCTTWENGLKIDYLEIVLKDPDCKAIQGMSH